MQVHILLSIAHSDNEMTIEGVYSNFKDAQKEMRERYESSKKFWENEGTDGYEEVNIEIGDDYADAYVVDADYEEIGMSWSIATSDVK